MVCGLCALCQPPKTHVIPGQDQDTHMFLIKFSNFYIPLMTKHITATFQDLVRVSLVKVYWKKYTSSGNIYGLNGKQSSFKHWAHMFTPLAWLPIWKKIEGMENLGHWKGWEAINPRWPQISDNHIETNQEQQENFGQV